ncbi:hypothetical protein QYF36_011422 [Acer negundo]|nr:hypothetical protein QYF36_011422 [Acer negundo]
MYGLNPNQIADLADMSNQSRVSDDVIAFVENLKEIQENVRRRLIEMNQRYKKEKDQPIEANEVERDIAKHIPTNEAEVIETVIQVREMKTQAGSYVRFLLKWMGRPDCENSWISGEEFMKIDVEKLRSAKQQRFQLGRSRVLFNRKGIMEIKLLDFRRVKYQSTMVLTKISILVFTKISLGN